MKDAGWAAAAAQTRNAIDSEPRNKRSSRRELARRPGSIVAHAVVKRERPFERGEPAAAASVMKDRKVSE